LSNIFRQIWDEHSHNMLEFNFHVMEEHLLCIRIKPENILPSTLWLLWDAFNRGNNSIIFLLQMIWFHRIIDIDIINIITDIGTRLCPNLCGDSIDVIEISVFKNYWENWFFHFSKLIIDCLRSKK
jgi:hypothetical protein